MQKIDALTGEPHVTPEAIARLRGRLIAWKAEEDAACADTVAGVETGGGEPEGMASDTEEKPGRGRPTLPYRTRFTRVLDGASFTGFLEAYHEGVREAHKRRDGGSAGADFVYLWKDAAGSWRVAGEFEECGEGLSADTDGVLLVWSSGEIGIAHHGRAVWPTPDVPAMVGRVRDAARRVGDDARDFAERLRAEADALDNSTP